MANILHCDECGQEMIIEENGVSHHVKEDTKEIDFDQDADHVPYTTE